MDGKVILGSINYFVLGLILLFGILALSLRKQRKKLTFLFLLFFCSGIISYLFFSGIAFIIPGIIILFFCVLLFLFVFNQEFFTFKKKHGAAEKNIGRHRFAAGILINIFISIIFCLGIAYLLFIYTRGYYLGVELASSFSIMGMSGITDDIGSNYIPVAFIIIGMLTVSVIWFIGILKNRGDKN